MVINIRYTATFLFWKILVRWFKKNLWHKTNEKIKFIIKKKNTKWKIVKKVIKKINLAHNLNAIYK